jgi:hypothetical protein
VLPGLKWLDVKEVMQRVRFLIKSWHLLCLDKHSDLLDANLMLLDRCWGSFFELHGYEESADGTK